MKNLNPRIQLVCYVAAACFGLAPIAFAVDPPPDGGYPGENTAEGEDALFSLTTGVQNTAVGFEALYSNTGSFNTAIGFQALYLNTSGFSNIANGGLALQSNTSGVANTATGYAALSLNTTASYNTATGEEALYSNTASFNTADGQAALYNNETGQGNTAIGYRSLFANTTGYSNTACGAGAMEGDGYTDYTTGSDNTATGANALFLLTTGSDNAATGSQALFINTTGKNNTANGYRALAANTTGSNNTAIGFSSLSKNTGGSNIVLGESAGINLTTGSNNIDIGNKGVAGESNTIRIGKKGTQTATFIAGISGATVAGGVGVIIDTAGHLGTVVSSARFKEQIKPMDRTSETILALQPVTFHYKKDLDPDGIPQFGLVAEQVEKVNPDLVARDEQGKPYTVRYEAVNAMLLNEFLKEHRKVEALETTVATQQKGFESQIAALTSALKAQAARIQKVSDQFRTQAAVPRVVAND